MDYVLAYVIGSFGGYAFERAQGKQHCDRLAKHAGLGCWPTLQVYGAGLVLLLFLYRHVDLHIGLLALLAAALLSLFECAAGHAATRLFGQPGWHYAFPDAYCSGYNSLRITMGWFLLSLLVFYVFQWLGIKRNATRE